MGKREREGVLKSAFPFSVNKTRRMENLFMKEYRLALQLVGDGRMYFSGLKPHERVDDADRHNGYVEADGFPVGVGDLTKDIEAGADEADPHDHVEDGSGHPEDGFLPLLGEHVGNLSHVEDKDGGLNIGAKQGHVGDSRDVDAQEEGRHGDNVVNEEVFVSSFVLGMQSAKALGQPAVVRKHDERDGHRANQAVKGGGGCTQRAAGHEEEVFRPC